MKNALVCLLIIFSGKLFAQWINSTSVQHPTYISYGCTVLPNNTVFVTGVEGDINQTFQSSIYRSTNSGVTFTIVKNISGGSCESIKFLNNNVGVAVNNNLSSSLFKTVDGGNVWTEYSLTLPNNYNGNLKDIYFLDSSVLYLTANDKIFKCINYAQTPIALNEPLDNAVIDEVQFLTDNLGFCIAQGSAPFSTLTGGLYRTTDGGNTWKSIIPYTSRLESFKFFDADNGVTLSSDGTIHKTVNGGINWTKVRTGNGNSNPYFYQLQFINPLVGYAVGQKEIIGTIDGGQTWSSLHTVGLNFSLQNIFVNKNGIGISSGLTFGNYSYSGNFGGLSTNVTVPTAFISGFDSVCSNSPGTIRFDFTGSGPWSITYSDGTSSFNLNNITTTPYFVNTTVVSNKTYTITTFNNNGTVSSNKYGKAYSRLILTNQTANISGNKTMCTGDSAQIVIRFTGAKPVTFTYTDGTTPKTILNYTDSVYKIFVKPLVTSTYTILSIKDVCNNSGTFSGSALVTITPPPAAPTNFALTDSNRKILLTWTDNANNEDSIIIERKVQGQNVYSRLKVLLPNITQFTDTSIAYQKWYYYKITYKKNGVNCFGVSNIDSIYANYPPSKFPLIALNNLGIKGIRNAVWFDVDNDGDQDIIFGNLIVYKNMGGDNFEYAYSFPNVVVLDSVNGSSIKVTDINNDGKVDYFLQNVRYNGKRSAVTLSDNGNFNMVAGQFDYKFYDTINLSDNYMDFVNYNNDKRLDVVANYHGVINETLNPFNGTYTGADVYLNGSQTLPYTAVSFGKIFNNTGQKVLRSFNSDYTGDKFQDLIAASSSGVRMFKFNNSNLTSSKYEDSGAVSMTSTTNIDFADINNDKVMDLILAAGFVKKYVGKSLGYYTDITPNNYGDFNSTNALNVSSFATEDFNNDGWVDIFMIFPSKPPILFMNNKNNTFSKYDFGYLDFKELATSTVALADYNDDGKVDMFAGNKLLKNTLPFNNNWINIKLIPVATNRIPYGSKIRLKANINGQDVWQQREIYAGANSVVAHFGLGNATRIDSIIIVWPNHVQTDSALRSINENSITNLTNLSTINQSIEIIQPTRVLQILSFVAGTTKAYLKWNTITSANNYYLQRKENSDSIFRQVYLGNTINFNDTTLLPNTTYLYKISAFSLNDTLTESVYLTTNEIKLNVTANSNLSNLIVWTKPESSIIKQRLFRKQGSGPFVFIKDIQNINSHVDTSLQDATSYCYFIQTFYALDSTKRMNTDTVCVSTVAQITLSAGNDQTICEGQAVSITASGANSYAWNTGAQTPSITVSPIITSTYIVTGTLGVNTSKDTVVVFVNPKPSVSTGEDKSICTGSSTTITATGASAYSWNSGQNSSSITVAPNLTTTYIVTGTSAQNCSGKDTITISLKPLPNVAFTKVITGAQVQLNAPNGNATYNWSFGDATANSTIQNPIHTYAVSGMYYINLVSSLNGCTAQKTDSINIIATAIRNTISFLNQINIYPNPTNDLVFIKMESKKPATFNIQLIGVDGKIIFTKEYKNTITVNDMIDVRTYSSGVYMLQVESGSEQTVYRIIKE